MNMLKPHLLVKYFTAIGGTLGLSNMTFFIVTIGVKRGTESLLGQTIHICNTVKRTHLRSDIQSASLCPLISNAAALSRTADALYL